MQATAGAPGNWGLILAYTALTGLGLAYFWRYKRLNPIFWFMLGQWLMAVGSIYLADMEHPADQMYVLLFFLAKAVYLAAAIVAWERSRIRERFRQFWDRPLEDDSAHAKAYTWLIMVLAAFVTVWYYKSVGYNIFLNIILGVAVEDFSTMRLAAYSGDTYHAAGYVNQFKNVLLPVCVSVVAAWAWLRGERLRLWTVVIAGGCFCVVALLGTGQRAFLAYAFAAMAFGLTAVRDIRPKALIFPGLIIFSLFTFMTSLYKATQFQEGDNVVLLSIGKSFERFFVGEQEGALGAFRHLYAIEPVWFEEWKDQFLGIFPGHKGSTLQHDLFFLVHGTDRGTEGYATLSGFFHNGGLPTVFICYVLLAVFHLWIYQRFLLGARSVLRVFAYGALSFHLAIFVSGGPVTLINNGVVTLVILLFVRRINPTIPAVAAPTPAPALGSAT